MIVLDISTFRQFDAGELMGRLRGLPDVPAVYLVLLREGDRLLELTGYFDFNSRLPYRMAGYDHLYTGASGAWGTRVRRHLAGDARVSTLRRTLLAIERQLSALSRASLGPVDRIRSEIELDTWIAANVRIAIKETPRPFEVENLILRSEPSPLNIDGRRKSPYAQVLTLARDAELPKCGPRRVPFRDSSDAELEHAVNHAVPQFQDY